MELFWGKAKALILTKFFRGRPIFSGGRAKWKVVGAGGAENKI